MGTMGEIFRSGLHDQLDDIEQTSSVEAYFNKFEAIKSLVSDFHPWLPEAYFADRFIYGLREDIQPYVIRFHPHTVLDVFHLSCIYEYLVSEQQYDSKDVVDAHNFIVDVYAVVKPCDSIGSTMLEISLCEELPDIFTVNQGSVVIDEGSMVDSQASNCDFNTIQTFDCLTKITGWDSYMESDSNVVKELKIHCQGEEFDVSPTWIFEDNVLPQSIEFKVFAPIKRKVLKAAVKACPKTGGHKVEVARVLGTIPNFSWEPGPSLPALKMGNTRFLNTYVKFAMVGELPYCAAKASDVVVDLVTVYTSAVIESANTFVSVGNKSTLIRVDMGTTLVMIASEIHNEKLQIAPRDLDHKKTLDTGKVTRYAAIIVRLFFDPGIFMILLYASEESFVAGQTKRVLSMVVANVYLIVGLSANSKFIVSAAMLINHRSRKIPLISVLLQVQETTGVLLQVYAINSDRILKARSMVCLNIHWQQFKVVTDFSESPEASRRVEDIQIMSGMMVQNSPLLSALLFEMVTKVPTIQPQFSTIFKRWGQLCATFLGPDVQLAQYAGASKTMILLVGVDPFVIGSFVENLDGQLVHGVIDSPYVLIVGDMTIVHVKCWLVNPCVLIRSSASTVSFRTALKFLDHAVWVTGITNYKLTWSRIQFEQLIGWQISSKQVGSSVILLMEFRPLFGYFVALLGDNFLGWLYFLRACSYQMCLCHPIFIWEPGLLLFILGKENHVCGETGVVWQVVIRQLGLQCLNGLELLIFLSLDTDLQCHVPHLSVFPCHSMAKHFNIGSVTGAYDHVHIHSFFKGCGRDTTRIGKKNIHYVDDSRTMEALFDSISGVGGNQVLFLHNWSLYSYKVHTTPHLGLLFFLRLCGSWLMSISIGITIYRNTKYFLLKQTAPQESIVIQEGEPLKSGGPIKLLLRVSKVASCGNKVLLMCPKKAIQLRIHRVVDNKISYYSYSLKWNVCWGIQSLYVLNQFPFGISQMSSVASKGIISTATPRESFWKMRCFDPGIRLENHSSVCPGINIWVVLVHNSIASMVLRNAAAPRILEHHTSQSAIHIFCLTKEHSVASLFLARTGNFMSRQWHIAWSAIVLSSRWHGPDQISHFIIYSASGIDMPGVAVTYFSECTQCAVAELKSVSGVIQRRVTPISPQAHDPLGKILLQCLALLNFTLEVICILLKVFMLASWTTYVDLVLEYWWLYFGVCADFYYVLLVTLLLVQGGTRMDLLWPIVLCGRNNTRFFSLVSLENKVIHNTSRLPDITDEAANKPHSHHLTSSFNHHTSSIIYSGISSITMGVREVNKSYFDYKGFLEQSGQWVMSRFTIKYLLIIKCFKLYYVKTQSWLHVSLSVVKGSTYSGSISSSGDCEYGFSSDGFLWCITWLLSHTGIQQPFAASLLKFPMGTYGRLYPKCIGGAGQLLQLLDYLELILGEDQRCGMEYEDISFLSKVLNEVFYNNWWKL